MKPAGGKRVGIRQWRVLLAADSAGPDGIDDEQVRDAVGRDFSPAQARVVLGSLLNQGLLARDWQPGRGCTAGKAHYTVTEAGAACQLDVAGRGRARKAQEPALV